MPAAPTAPPAPTKPAPAPTPASPKPASPPERDPMVPRRREEPAPAHAFPLLWGSAPSMVRKFWERIPADHPYHDHHVLATHGQDLAAGAFEYFYDEAQPAAKYRTSETETIQAFVELQCLERPFKKQLEALARKVVAQVWGIDPRILRPTLTNNVDVARGLHEAPGGFGELPEIPPKSGDAMLKLYATFAVNAVHMYFSGSVARAYSSGADMGMYQTGSSRLAWPDQLSKPYSPQNHRVKKGRPSMSGLSPRLRDAVLKKVSANLLTQGASVHQMMTIHHLAAGELRDLFDGVLTVDERDPGYPPKSQPLVIAKAANFPILLQELSKGVMAIIMSHGFEELSDADFQTVCDIADYGPDEFHLIQAGPQLWRYLLRTVPSGTNLKGLLMSLIMLERPKVDQVLGAVAGSLGTEPGISLARRSFIAAGAVEDEAKKDDEDDEDEDDEDEDNEDALDDEDDEDWDDDEDEDDEDEEDDEE